MLKTTATAVSGLMLPILLLPLLSMGLAEGQVKSAVLEGEFTRFAVQ